MNIQRGKTFVLEVLPMVPADMDLLRNKTAKVVIKKIRDNHHVIARLFAEGMKSNEVAAAVGMTPTRVSALRNCPAMEDLVARYRNMETEDWREERDFARQRIVAARDKAWRMINEQLDDADEAGEVIPINKLLAIADSAADRTGLHRKTATQNVNIDFAVNLEKAIARAKQVTTIDI